jgi:hypothetical protein
MSAVTAAFRETGQNGYGAATPPQAPTRGFGALSVTRKKAFPVRNANLRSFAWSCAGAAARRIPLKWAPPPAGCMFALNQPVGISIKL